MQASEFLKLSASDATAIELFGFSVSVSADGTTALVGAFLDDNDGGTNAGAAYVYELTQTPPAETKLTASDAAASDRFGAAVSLSRDGSTALVGAYWDDAGGTHSGAAYVYDLAQHPPTETQLTASDAAAGDEFGFSVSVSADGTTALVGAHGDDVGGSWSGSAYVYDLTQRPPAETKLTASDAAAGDEFGFSVSVSADGNTAIVGARGDDDGAAQSGSAYVYDLTQRPPAETKLTASDAAAVDLFGTGVAVSADGTTGLVGTLSDANGIENSGSAYVYDLTQHPPTETKLTANDADPYDFFGVGVSLSEDGSTALVGASEEDDAGPDSGSMYVYDLTQTPPTETKLTATDATDGDRFGRSVSISGDGIIALVGAPWDDDAGTASGSAYVFELVFLEPIELPNGTVVTPVDRDGDGLYEDLDCDGDVDGQDVSRLTRLENAYRKGDITLTPAQVAALDFNGDGQFTKADIPAYTAMFGL